MANPKRVICAKKVNVEYPLRPEKNSFLNIHLNIDKPFEIRKKFLWKVQIVNFSKKFQTQEMTCFWFDNSMTGRGRDVLKGHCEGL